VRNVVALVQRGIDLGLVSRIVPRPREIGREPTVMLPGAAGAVGRRDSRDHKGPA